MKNVEVKQRAIIGLCTCSSAQGLREMKLSCYCLCRSHYPPPALSVGTCCHTINLFNFFCSEYVRNALCNQSSLLIKQLKSAKTKSFSIAFRHFTWRQSHTRAKNCFAPVEVCHMQRTILQQKKKLVIFPLVTVSVRTLRLVSH